jgi:hypothetical protein
MNAWRLLRLEGQKFLPNTTCRVVLALYGILFALALFLVWMLGDLQMTLNGVPSKPLAELHRYPVNWQIVAWVGSWANVFLLGFLGVFMATLEFQCRTLRQGILFGLTRRESAAAKILAAGALSLAAMAIYLLFGLVHCLVGAKGLSLPPLASLLGFGLQAFGYLLLGLLLGIWIRQAALATLLYFAYVLFLEILARGLFYLFTKSSLLKFLPDSVFEKLTPFPFSLGDLGDSLSRPEAYGAWAAWTLLLAALIFRRLDRSDL